MPGDVNSSRGLDGGDTAGLRNFLTSLDLGRRPDSDISISAVVELSFIVEESSHC